MRLTKEDIIVLAQRIEDLGAHHVIVLHISGQFDWADYVLIASFSSGRQGLGLLAETCTWLRDHDAQIKVSDQNPENCWFVCDAGDLIVHLLKDDMRDFYALETLWKDAHTIYPVLGD